jgi:hypothetical protein
MKKGQSNSGKRSEHVAQRLPAYRLDKMMAESGSARIRVANA